MAHDCAAAGAAALVGRGVEAVAGISLVGQRLPMPVVLAPWGLIRVVGGDGGPRSGQLGMLKTMVTTTTPQIQAEAAPQRLR
jgi:hypothetical protein